jgi:hypothetical protein
MILPLLVLLIGLAGATCSLRSFNRKCAEARANYDPIRAAAPRGLARR